MPSHLKKLFRLAAIASVSLLIQPAFAQDQSHARSCQAALDGEARLVTFESRNSRGLVSPVDGVFIEMEGSDSRPTILLLPTYFGVEPPECYRWMQKMLLDWGYQSLLIDHVSPGFQEAGRGYDHSLYDRLADVEGAIAFLKKQASVDPDRIAMAGWSQGALSALLALDPKRAFVDAPEFPIRAVVAYYPTCPVREDRFPIPVLVMHGTADKDAPFASCERLAESQKDHPGFSFAALEGADHQFDHPGHIHYDKESAGLAENRLKEFLDAYLGDRK